MLLFNRRNWAVIGRGSLYILECRSMDDVVELTTNHFIGMRLSLEAAVDDGVGGGAKRSPGFVARSRWFTLKRN